MKLERLLAEGHKSVVLLRQLASVKLAASRPLEAETILRRGLSAYPRNVLLGRRLAATLLRVNRPSEAVEIGVQLVAEGPQDPANHVTLVRSLSILRGPAVAYKALLESIETSNTRTLGSSGWVATSRCE